MRQRSIGSAIALASLTLTLTLMASPAVAADPIPPRLVVLTFDDSVKSHFTVARPILKKYGFGATFFITEGFNFRTNKADYMSWSEIRALYDDGFEIGNHTLDHMGLSAEKAQLLEQQLTGIDDACRAHGIPKPISFAWPGNLITPEALDVLKRHGIVWGRRGGWPEYPRETGFGVPYEPARDHPLLIPSIGVPRPSWDLPIFISALDKLEEGSIAVLQFHGVPEGEHPWVNTSRDLFEQYMDYLHANGFRVIALRDLANWVDPKAEPDSAWEIIDLRKAILGSSN